MRVGVRADGGHGVLCRLRAGEIALGEFQARRDRVDVRVLESGQQEPPGQVHYLGARADQVVDLGVPHGGDPLAGDGHRGRGSALGGEHRAAGEEKVSVHGSVSFVGEAKGPRSLQLGVARSWGASASVPCPVVKYGDLRTHLAHAAARKPEAIMTVGASSRNQPLSALTSKWSVEV